MFKCHLVFLFFSLQSHHIYVIQILKIELGYHVFVYSSTPHDETSKINMNIYFQKHQLSCIISLELSLRRQSQVQQLSSHCDFILLYLGSVLKSHI